MRIPLLAILLGSVAFGVSAQEQTTRVKSKGAHHRDLELITTDVAPRGEKIFSTNQVVELANGLHYWDGKEWQTSDPVFVNTDQGAIAYKVPYQLTISPDLMDEGVVNLLTIDAKRFVSNPAFLAYRDLVTGESVLISEVKSSVGKFVSPTQVMFEDAFANIQGSVRFSITAEGMEQDVLLQGNVPTPTDLGLEPNGHGVRLEMWTRFSESGDLVNAVEVPAGQQDDVELHFGEMWIGQGKAFELGEEGKGVPVAKRWGESGRGNEKWLVEMVHLDDAGHILEKLQANAGRPGKVKRMAQQKKARNDKELVGMFSRGFEAKEKHKKTMMAGVTVGLRGGNAFVIDYATLSSGQANYTFNSATTYYISGNLTMSGLTTFEGGTVIKFAPTNTATLTVSSNIVWTGQNYRPVIMTGRDDHSVGQRIGTAALSGLYADTAFAINASAATAGAIVNNLQVRHANTAIKIQTRTDHVFSNVQLVNCNSGIKLSASCGYALRNALFDNVKTNLTGGATSTAHLEHITSDTADFFNFSGTDLQINITNSILAGVTSVGSLLSSQNVATPASSAGIFQSAVNGRHYLANDTYRNAGTANVSIFSEIQKKTTYPPVILTGPFSVSTTWTPLATRDTDSPDYGFHFDPIDVFVKEQVASATIKLAGGVVMGVYGTNGINLQSGAKFLSEGKPDTLNRMVKYSSVQSSTNVWDTSSDRFSMLMMSNTPAVRPDIHIRFTELPFVADGTGRMLFFDGQPNVYTRFSPNQIRFMDSQFLNMEFNYYPDTAGVLVSFTNCLMERVNFAFGENGTFGQKAFSLWMQNNSIVNGGVGLTHSTNTYSWNFYDNLFASASITPGGAYNVTSARNGYKGVSVFPGSAGGDVVLTLLDFQSGPLGSFYNNTTTNGTNTAYLINKDTVNTAGGVGLYHYTTRVDQSKDGVSTGLDIGFHYIATTGSSSTTPIDTDGDGVFDYIEDANGDSSVNSGESHWNSATDQTLRVKISQPKATSNVP